MHHQDHEGHGGAVSTQTYGVLEVLEYSEYWVFQKTIYSISFQNF